MRAVIVGILDSPLPPNIPTIPPIAMDFLNWEFAEAPAADAENRADYNGNPEARLWDKVTINDYVYSQI